MRPSLPVQAALAPLILLLAAGCPGGPGGRDNYTCVINSAGHCLFTGSPHALDTSATREGFEQVQDANGAAVKPMGKPIQDGYVLGVTSWHVTDPDELAYVKVFKVMAPVRDAMMYDIAALDSARWRALTRTLTDNGVKTESKNLETGGGCGGPSNPREMEYSTVLLEADLHGLRLDRAKEPAHRRVCLCHRVRKTECKTSR